MDFGSICLFRPQFVGGVIDLYKALRDGTATAYRLKAGDLLGLIMRRSTY